MFFDSANSKTPSLFLQIIFIMLLYLKLTGQASLSWWIVPLPLLLPYTIVLVGGTALYLYWRITGKHKKEQVTQMEITKDTTAQEINDFVSKVINAGKADVGGPTKDEKLSKWFRK